MMRHSGSKLFGRVKLASFAILLLFISLPAYAQDSTALMLQISPIEGGTVNLEAGVHVYDRDAEVTLTAVPRHGYQFVYWLGNVIEPTASTTIVRLDSPKIVIAVFERSKFEIIDVEEKPQPSGGGGGLRRSPGDYAQGLEQAGGGRQPPKFHRPKNPETEDDTPVPEPGEDFPVPEPGDDFPVPEPATITLMITGALLLTKYRRKNSDAKTPDAII